ncbi:hypothetical protein AXG93_1800s1000 [Marchantia polymorpha subsp. ruderalis]|uniref:Uncharacterized protein n=1 Tax=Marchantia polymorpha subsp. ruderalis TaxID=1480154 RepID=A0A176VVC1_MARPO|nr:hypothetical protein AXG93_1800s1000 [Marchantia polymorpha subsp. ruderalis]
MNRWDQNYVGKKRRPGFLEDLVQPSGGGIWPSALMSLELLKRYLWRRIPSEIRDGAARERNLNDDTFSSHQLILPLRRRTTPMRGRVRPPHFTIALLQIDERLWSRMTMTLQNQRDIEATSKLGKFEIGPVESSASKKEKGKKVVTEEGIQDRNPGPSTEAVISALLEKTLEVLTVSLDTEVDPVSLEKIVDRVVEDVARETTTQQPVASPQTSTGTIILEIGEDPLAEEIQSKGINAVDMLCGQVVTLLRNLDSKLDKYARSSNVGSYVELVCNRTRVKVAAANSIVEKVESLTAERATTKTLLRRRRSNSWSQRRITRQEVSRVAFNEESCRVNELTADLAKRNQAHAAELAAKVKALAECEVVRSLKLELLDK